MKKDYSLAILIFAFSILLKIGIIVVLYSMHKVIALQYQQVTKKDY